jgi:hypothetical protein
LFLDFTALKSPKVRIFDGNQQRPEEPLVDSPLFYEDVTL